jgi:hypothetical protein
MPLRVATLQLMLDMEFEWTTRLLDHLQFQLNFIANLVLIVILLLCSSTNTDYDKAKWYITLVYSLIYKMLAIHKTDIRSGFKHKCNSRNVLSLALYISLKFKKQVLVQHFRYDLRHQCSNNYAFQCLIYGLLTVLKAGHPTCTCKSAISTVSSHWVKKAVFGNVRTCLGRQILCMVSFMDLCSHAGGRMVMYKYDYSWLQFVINMNLLVTKHI